MIAAGLLGSLCIILVVIYMARPPLDPRVLSAARFFNILPPARKSKEWRLRPGNLRLSLPFCFQLLVLLLLTAAVLLSQVTKAAGEAQRIGMWIVVDTSASMSTSQDGVTRMQNAYWEIEQAIAKAEKAGTDAGLCLQLSGFDLDPWYFSTGGTRAVQQAARTLEPRPLGTDLDIVRNLFNSLGDQSESECTITHFVVVCDLPAPAWVISSTAQVIWRDVGSVVDNVGFTNIQGGRHPLTGLVREVNVEITAYGAAPADAELVVTAPDGSSVLDETLTWLDDNTWQGMFSPADPGLYHLEVSPGGAYGYDDHAVIEISDGEVIRVDWQLDDYRLPEQLGWVEDRERPHLRVVRRESVTNTIPILIVGSGYRQEGGGQIEILDFYEISPLLADLNFDVAESLGIQGIALPEGFQPVLRDVHGLVWLAQRDSPPAAYVPGLPTSADDNLGRFSTTVFFNAVRWLLQERPLPPLYTLTEPTPGRLNPEGNRLALHEDEGNTARTPHSYGSFDDLKPVRTGNLQEPRWPMFLTLAMLVFLIERGCAAFRSKRWHS